MRRRVRGCKVRWVRESTEDKQVRVDANATNAIDVAGKDEAARQTTQRAQKWSGEQLGVVSESRAYAARSAVES